MNQWTCLQDKCVPDWWKQKIYCLEGIDGDKQWQIPRGHRTILGKSSVLDVIKLDILLAIAPRNNSVHISNASGNHDLVPAITIKWRLKKIMSKYVRYAMTALLNKEHKIGSLTLQMSKTM